MSNVVNIFGGTIFAGKTLHDLAEVYADCVRDGHGERVADEMARLHPMVAAMVAVEVYRRLSLNSSVGYKFFKILESRCSNSYELDN